jgi:mannonate dehydratase
MDRRAFIQRGGSAAAAAAGAAALLRPAVGEAAPNSVTAAVQSVAAEKAAGVVPRPIKRPLKLHVGSQRRANTNTEAQFLVRHGVKHWVPSPRTSGDRGYWVPSDLYPVLDFAAANGLTVEMVALPFLGSTNVNTERRPAIMLGKSPERDRDIEDIQKCIAALAAVGIPAFKYNMSILGVTRTAPTPGRGNSTYSTFNASQLDPNAPPTIAGTVTADMFWERIDYFVKRVIPVCDQYRIQAACHPQDPGTPPGGYQGVLENVLSTPGGMGLFKFLSLYDSPYHGLNLCIGVLAEMLWHPQEIYDITRALARTKRLFNIHLRNIRGRRDNFQEVYSDEGDTNLARIVQILAEEGYQYSIDPDHEPNSPDDSGGLQGFAHGFGYIEALIKSVDTLAPPHNGWPHH